MTQEDWYTLKRQIQEGKDSARRSTHEMARVKLGILCLVEEWMQDLEKKHVQH